MEGIYEYTRDNHRLPECWEHPDNTCLPHFHSSIELLYVTKGEAWAVLDGNASLLQEGQFAIVPSYAIHYYRCGENGSSYVLTIPLEMIPSYHAFFAQKTFAQYCCTDHSGGELLHCLKELERLSQEEQQEHSLPEISLFKGYLYILLGLVLEETDSREISENQSSSLAKKILLYLQQNYQNDLSLSSLAQTFGYSKSRFSYLFHRYFGCGLLSYINNLRCNAAADRMLHQETTMTEISMNVGFDSIRTFYRAFRRCYGMTPSEYIARNSAVFEKQPQERI